MRKIRVIVMAKAPVPGFAKTRLIPALGSVGAAHLAKRLLLCAIDNAIAADVGAAQLCVEPGPDDPVWSSLQQVYPITWSAQCEGDLGARLAEACKHAIDQGDAVLVMGTDCPALTPERLRSAADSLQRADAVIIPATDGGYTLLGINAFHASIFQDISWSTEKVFTETIQRFQQLKWLIEILPSLHDIDEPQDLRWLPSDLKEALAHHEFRKV
jgi:uncharacterized protein